MFSLLLSAIFGGSIFLAAFPSTANYQLQSYTIGGSSGTSSTANYALEGSTEPLAGASASTANYTLKPAFIQTQQAHVPSLSAFDNNGGTYSTQLHFVINNLYDGTHSFPTDTKFALSISTDNFVSDVKYVKSTLTVGTALTTADYQTYSAWGSSTGSIITGLTAGTTYYLKVKATSGLYTESIYGPILNVATVSSASLSFAITSSSTVAMGSIVPGGSPVTSPSTIDATFSTGATKGGYIYISGTNGGLLSTTASHTISSATADLAVATNGFGARVTSVGQTSGGPILKLSPYDGTGNNVGIIDATLRPIASSTAASVTGGTLSFQLQAKASITDQAATDYGETITLVAAAIF